MTQRSHATYVTAYLYHALRLAGMPTRTWPELDLFIKANMKGLFGGELPKRLEDIRGRFLLYLGVPLTVFGDVIIS